MRRRLAALFVSVAMLSFVAAVRARDTIRVEVVDERGSPRDWASRDDLYESSKVEFEADAKKPTVLRVEEPRRRLFP